MQNTRTNARAARRTYASKQQSTLKPWQIAFAAIMIMLTVFCCAMPHNVHCKACGNEVAASDARDYNGGDKTIWLCYDCIDGGALRHYYDYV